MSHLNPSEIEFGYDAYLGIDKQHILYILENHKRQARISGTPCYLLQRNSVGANVGYPGAQITPDQNQFSEINGQVFLVLWNGGPNYPDVRPYTTNSSGSITVYNNGVQMSRVLTVDDLTNNNEFTVVENKLASPPIVSIVFNIGFTASPANITYYYTTIEQGIENETIQRGDSNSQSIFNWTQYISSYQDYLQHPNQILVRFPINLHDIVITDEGRVTLENRDSWFAGPLPYLDDFDLLILAPEDSPDGTKYVYEIVNSTDSIIQRMLVSQRFKLNLLESTDSRYNIPYSTTA